MKTLKSILVTVELKRFINTVRKVKQDKIIWKPIVRTIQVPFCPKCKTEMFESGKDYKPYHCKCGGWYWIDDEEVYKIVK